MPTLEIGSQPATRKSRDDIYLHHAEPADLPHSRFRTVRNPEKLFQYDSDMPETDISPEFARARDLFSSGRYRGARRHCLAALEKEPDNPRIISLRARVD